VEEGGVLVRGGGGGLGGQYLTGVVGERGGIEGV
jgi:hypothetical protein